MEKRWYVVQTPPGKEYEARDHLLKKIAREKTIKVAQKDPETGEEKTVDANLLDFFDEIYVPEEPIYDNPKKKTSFKMKKLFTGYLFIKAALTPEVQVFIEKTPKILGFPGSKTSPSYIDPKKAEKIMASLKARRETPRSKYTFQEGDTVEIVNGPFSSFLGKIQSINEAKEEAVVAVSIFGRETPTTVKFKDIKEADAE